MEPKDAEKNHQKVNEHLLKISAGFIPIDIPFHIGQDVTLLVKGTITKIEIKDNQDGTVNQVYTVKGLYGDEIQVGTDQP